MNERVKQTVVIPVPEICEFCQSKSFKILGFVTGERRFAEVRCTRCGKVFWDSEKEFHS